VTTPFLWCQFSIWVRVFHCCDQIPERDTLREGLCIGLTVSKISVHSAWPHWFWAHGEAKYHGCERQETEQKEEIGDQVQPSKSYSQVTHFLQLGPTSKVSKPSQNSATSWGQNHPICLWGHFIFRSQQGINYFCALLSCCSDVECTSTSCICVIVFFPASDYCDCKPSLQSSWEEGSEARTPLGGLGRTTESDWGPHQMLLFFLLLISAHSVTLKTPQLNLHSIDTVAKVSRMKNADVQCQI
jgi:hypothetical protein